MRPIVSVSFDPADPNIIYAGTPHLAWKTKDGGESWASIHKGMLDDSDVFSILVDDRQRRRVFAGTCGGIYRSLDAGAQWYALQQPRGVSSRTYFLTQHPRFPSILFAGTSNGLLRSTDSGTSWTRLSSDSTRYISFDPVEPGRIFIAADDTGLFRSEDLGESLASINHGFTNRSFTSLVGSEAAIYLHLRYFGIGGILERGDGEMEWHALRPAASALQLFRLSASESGLLYGTTEDDVLVSSDHGLSWTPVPGPVTETSFEQVLFASADGKTLLMRAEDAVFRTADGGETWELAGSLQGMEFFGIVSTGSNGLFAATSRGLLRSSDKGHSWIPVAGQLSTGTVRAVIKHPTHPGLLFAAQYGNVYVSENDGRSWRRLAGAADFGAIQALAMTAENPRCLFALVQGRGVYRIDITGDSLPGL